ncbi:DedA family protein [Risungbinella massiliensis]|uniref:DedA family protein n=1 Tax=Risungbinella massiliensis TaxID=1329796 RepID=UPI0005CC84F5|nr:DedA family protein [Risungbinella massiliensis]
MQEFIASILEFLSELGYLGIAIGLMLEVIPSEIVLAYGGYMISIGEIGYVGAVIAGTIGGVLAQLFLYWLGYYGGRPMVEKYGKYILIKKSHLDVAEKWFERYGTGVIFGARFIPVVRHAISIPAGLAKMSATRFTILTTLAIIPWSIGFLMLGEQLGSNWASVKEVSGEYVSEIAIGVVVIFILYFGFQIWSKKKKEKQANV